MIVKVKHNELNQVSDTLINDSEVLDTEFANMNTQIEKLREIWQGVDAEIFCDNMSNYISRMNNITVAMRNMSNAITTVDNGYKAYDDAFSDALKSEADKYE